MPITNGSLIMASAKGSMARVDKRDKAGQPCLEPRLTVNARDLRAFVTTAA